MQRQVLLYAALMGVTWLMDVPALIRAQAPNAQRRRDSAIKHDEAVRAPLQMLVNVLNVWESRRMTTVLGQLTNHRT